jgi:hypothetical protein
VGSIQLGSIPFGLIAELDPAIHHLRKMIHVKVTHPRVKLAGDGGGWRGAESSQPERA